MEQDKEINGLSLVGVGRGTTIDNVSLSSGVMMTASRSGAAPST